MATNTKDLLTEVNSGITTAEVTLNNKLLDAVFDSNSASGSSSELEAFKNQVTVTGVKKSEVPEGVYEALATSVLNAVRSSTVKKLSTNQTTRTKEIGAAISGGLSSIANQKIPVGGTDYNVNVTIMSFAGMGDCFADISWKDSTGSKKAHLTWTNVGTQNGNQALAAFCSALADLNTQLWKEFASYALTGSTKAKKIYDYAEKIIKAINDKNVANKLIGEIGTIFSTEFKSNFRTFIKKNIPGGDAIVASADLLKTLETKKAALETAVNNNKNVDAKLKEFNTACANLEKKLGTSIGTFTLEPPAGMSYNSKYTEMTISSAYGNKLNVADYKENVTKINASIRSTAIEIEGNVKNNQIYGGYGADKIYGGKGKDTLYGGGGNDSLYGEKDADKIYGDAGNDVLSGGEGNDTLYGGADNDSLYGDAGTDKLYGDAGNDTLVGGLGNDTLTGGSGQDVFYYANGDGNDTILDYVSGEDKIKISSGSVSNYSVSGGKDAILKVGNGKITLKNVGNNQITVITSDNRTVTYGGISNGLTFNKADLPKATAATINSNYSGSFETGAYSSLVTVNASSRSNSISIVGNAKANKFYGGSAGDILSGGNGNDTLYGGSGNDSLYGEKDADKIYGDAGNDVLSGGDGNDTLYGGADNDSLYGDAGTDKLYGDAGNDTLIGGLGNDTLTGGAGKDVFYYTNGDGADVIVDFIANEDKIYISGATSVTGSLSKNDVTFKVGKGSIKVQNVKDKEIVIEYSNNTFGKYFNGKLIESGTISDIPDNATYYKGHYYRIYNDGMTWEEAKTFCENLGGHLVTITDESEQTAIENLLRFYGNKNCYWLGGYKENNNWQWITEETFSYTHWAYGEPNNYKSLENTAMIYYNSNPLAPSDLGNWNDVSRDGECNGEIFFGKENFGLICEWDENQYKPTDKIIPSNAFSYNGNYYYIYSNIGDDWEEAKKYCETLGGHLAVINNSAENTAVFNYMNSQGYDSAYFGLSNTIKAGTWNWVDGNQITYTNWADGEPNNEGGNENYAMFYYKFTDGKWNDGNPQKDPASFICEWEGRNVLTSARVAEDYWFAEDDNFMTNDSEVDSIIEENYSVTNIEISDFNSLTNDEFTLTYNQSENNQ